MEERVMRIDPSNRVEVYRELRKWFSNRRHWRKGQLATVRNSRNEYGFHWHGFDHGVVSTCLLGGFEKVLSTGHLQDDVLQPLVDCIPENQRIGSGLEIIPPNQARIMDWNDRRDVHFVDIQQAIDCALSNLESQSEENSI
jgi:hypothetical protein